jgi:hypothetical protein
VLLLQDKAGEMFRFCGRPAGRAATPASASLTASSSRSCTSAYRHKLAAAGHARMYSTGADSGSGAGGSAKRLKDWETLARKEIAPLEPHQLTWNLPEVMPCS